MNLYTINNIYIYIYDDGQTSGVAYLLLLLDSNIRYGCYDKMYNHSFYKFHLVFRYLYPLIDLMATRALLISSI